MDYTDHINRFKKLAAERENEARIQEQREKAAEEALFEAARNLISDVVMPEFDKVIEALDEAVLDYQLARKKTLKHKDFENVIILSSNGTELCVTFDPISDDVVFEIGIEPSDPHTTIRFEDVTPDVVESFCSEFLKIAYPIP